MTMLDLLLSKSSIKSGTTKEILFGAGHSDADRITETDFTDIVDEHIGIDEIEEYKAIDTVMETKADIIQEIDDVDTIIEIKD